MENKDKHVHTFNDWWERYSEEIFDKYREAKGDFNWYEAFEKCWNASQSLETRRCAELSANRLALEAERETAWVNGKLKEFLERASFNYEDAKIET